MFSAPINIDLQLRFISQLQSLLTANSPLRMVVVNFCHAKCRESSDFDGDDVLNETPPVYAKILHLVMQLATDSNETEFEFDFRNCEEPYAIREW